MGSNPIHTAPCYSRAPVPGSRSYLSANTVSRAATFVKTSRASRKFRSPSFTALFPWHYPRGNLSFTLLGWDGQVRSHTITALLPDRLALGAVLRHTFMGN